MNQESTRGLEFYQNLGKLFYAIALADGNIVEAEFHILKQELNTFGFDSNGLEADFKQQVISTFTDLHMEKRDAQACFNDFLDYQIKYDALFSKSIKKAILRMASKIASSFSGQNKSELIMLATLSLQFRKT